MRAIGLLVIESWRDHPSLVILVLFSLVCLIFSVAGLAFDHRLITGEHAWIKPCKFSISLTTYGLTLLWYSRFLTNHKQLLHRISVAALIGTIVELSAIITQVLRGTTSHFNTSSPFNHVMFWITTSAIVPVAVAIVILFVMLLREKRLPPVLGASLRWAMFLTIIGFVPAVLMILPDHLQDAITCYRQFDGHTVGFAEGGPGIPWLGWSTVAGDLRIAHFVGIHALQIMPIVGVSIVALLPKLKPTRQETLVWIFALYYLTAIVLLTLQALSAESFFAPGMHTRILTSMVLAPGLFAAAFTIWLPSVRFWKATDSGDVAANVAQNK